jgi:predicted permease
MFEVIGRLKPDVSIEQARREMVLIARRIEQQFPDIQVGRSVQIVNLQEQLVRNTRPTLIALFGAVGFVLLIACANVANLLLARATARRREIAIRTALGASRAQLLFQFLTESVLIALLGGMVGIVLAKIGMASLIAWAGPYLPRAQEVTLDLRVLAFSVGLSILTGVICGIIPGWQSSKEEIQLALKQGGTSAGSPQSNWATGLLAIGETAGAVILLIGAGLFMKSVLRLEHVDPGFQVQNVVTMKMALPPDTYKPEAAARFYTDLRQRVAQLPGVQAVGVINLLPIESYGFNGSVDVEGLPHFVNDPVWAIEYRFVSPGYFHALNIPLVRGRDFLESDFGRGSQFAMVNQTFARMISQYGDPLGRHILNALDDPKAAVTIVGIAADVHQAGLDLPVRPEVYFLNDMPIPSVGAMNLVVRTVGDPGALVGAVRHEVAAIDPNQTAYEVKTMQTVVDNSMSGRRFTRTLIMVFALLGTLLAVIGVYSVLSYLVTQHTREIGIRLALGAQRAHVVNMVLKQGVVVGLLGLGIGAIGAFALTRLLSSMLFQVKSYDLPTFFGASALLFAVVLIASYLPARRTTQVDPMVALRQD